MKFEFTNCVALQTTEPQKAREFYEKVMGIQFDQEEAGSKYARCGSLLFFLDHEDKLSGPVLDIVVSDLEKAKSELLKNGCKIIKWDKTGIYLKDPFGLCFNLSEGSC